MTCICGLVGAGRVLKGYGRDLVLGRKLNSRTTFNRKNGSQYNSCP